MGMHFTDAVTRGDRLDVQLGRMTIDNGSRRFVARNSFRNTLNAFTGMRATRKGNGPEVLLMIVLPVQRKPADFASLQGNDHEFDTGSDQRCGAYSRPGRSSSATSPVKRIFYGFRSRDHVGIPVADRDLYTPGVRLLPDARAFSEARTQCAGRWQHDLCVRCGDDHLLKSFKALVGWLQYWLV